MTHPTEEQPLILRATDREQVRVYASTYRGKTKLHLRKFWLDPKEEAWKPSREGIALSKEELDQLMPVFQVALEGNVLS